MAFNEFMHPRNPYKNHPPDFKELADLYPNFKDHVHVSKTGKAFVKFRNPEVVRDLAICLFEKDFNLKVELPDDRLSPTLPLRINYLLWLEDLLNCLSNSVNQLTILDIGCGSSCVYPLLGSKMNKMWKFIATEIDKKNILYATRNVKNNNLFDKIEIKQVDRDDPLLGNFEFDVCMCNPPFFTRGVEQYASNRPIPNSSCAGYSSEILGGDFQYAERIFNESLKLKSQKLWYTIMLGKKSSFISLQKLLHHADVKTTAFTEFCQGQTMRWGAAWSYIDIDTSKVVKIKPSKTKKPKLFTFSSKFFTVKETLEATRLLLDTLSVVFEQEDKFKFKLKGNVCKALPNRKARRKKHNEEEQVNDFPAAKKLKLDSSSAADEFHCHLTIVPIDYGPARVELISDTCQFPDLLNRFYLFIRERL